MPENSIYVGRPSKWGNPFKFELYNSYGKKGAILYYCINRKIFDSWIYYDSGPFEFKDVIYFYEQWITGKLTDKIGLPDVPKISELRGKNLACFCPLNQPCHADVLLKLANEP